MAAGKGSKGSRNSARPAARPHWSLQPQGRRGWIRCTAVPDQKAGTMRVEVYKRDMQDGPRFPATHDTDKSCTSTPTNTHWTYTNQGQTYSTSTATQSTPVGSLIILSSRQLLPLHNVHPRGSIIHPRHARQHPPPRHLLRRLPARPRFPAHASH